MKLSKIDSEQRLYVLSEGRGFSAIGFDVIEQRARAMAREVINRAQGQTIHFVTWLECLNDVESNPKGSQDHFDLCNNIHDYAQIHASVFGPLTSGLHAALKGFEGKRVEATVEGEKKRFQVGRSTGWFPCHLTLANKRSHGGSPLSPWATVENVREVV